MALTHQVPWMALTHQVPPIEVINSTGPLLAALPDCNTKFSEYLLLWCELSFGLFIYLQSHLDEPCRLPRMATSPIVLCLSSCHVICVPWLQGMPPSSLLYTFCGVRSNASNSSHPAPYLGMAWEGSCESFGSKCFASQ